MSYLPRIGRLIIHFPAGRIDSQDNTFSTGGRTSEILLANIFNGYLIQHLKNIF